MSRRTPAERFFQKVEFTERCWNWLGAKSYGYGHFWVGDGKRIQAHRWAYIFCVGEIPDGLQLDHLCRNRSCVRPDHLEPVTNRENCARGINVEVQRELWRESGLAGHNLVRTAAGQWAKAGTPGVALLEDKTHCASGHPLNEENVYDDPRGRRECRICRTANDRRRKAKRRKELVRDG